MSVQVVFEEKQEGRKVPRGGSWWCVELELELEIEEEEESGVETETKGWESGASSSFWVI